MTLSAEKQDVLEKVERDEVKFINLQFTDIHGTVKSVGIPVHRLAEVLDKGSWFDGSSIQGFARIHESDMVLHPDPKTYQVLPWKAAERRTARLICDVHRPDGKPFEGDPRYILRRAIEKASELGYTYNCGPELEFFLLQKRNQALRPVPHDVAGYFDLGPRDLATAVRNDIVDALHALDIEVEMEHHEVASGQHEIDFRYAGALAAADNAITFKQAVKAIATKHDLYASFMPKPFYGQNGSGMHTHQSLFKEENNIFYDADDPYRLSQTAYGFIGGQLKHARALSAIVAPTVNSYKRLVPGYEAPVYICWARINRAALIRIPNYSPGREQSTRVELRFPDPSCNPYLAFAVMLAAGLDGIRDDVRAPAPVEEDVYHFDESRLQELNIQQLPGSLGEAIGELEADDVLMEALGEHTARVFIEAKRAEWDEYRMQVTEWELDRYLETL
ncbi:MAG: type I glutamate--ammonia ligase [Candidatus Promineifilaceae bacterium]|nr:type I glutamate--ammonia ligase [Candidatus Promineifilaceae bacterium]